MKDVYGIKKKQIKVFDLCYDELEAIVYSEYGERWSFVNAMNCCNDTLHDFIVTKEYDPFDFEDLHSFREGKFPNIGPDIILNDLCKRNIIPQGKYLITVYW